MTTTRIPLGLRLVLWVMVGCFVGVVGFAAGYATCWLQQPEARYPVGDAPEEHAERFRVFWEAWHLVEKEFYTIEPLDPQEMTYGAIRGMVATLDDPHTAWVEPKVGDLLREDLTGRFQGIGATVNMVDGYLTIVGTLPDSPARRAGLMRDDVVLEADGVPITGTDVLYAISLIRGPAGTTVELEILRQTEDGPQEFTVVVERARLELPTVEHRMLPDGIAYLQISDFNARAPGEVRRALSALLRENPTGLVLDLRDNPGGLLTAAVDVASEFISSGIIVRERHALEDEANEYEARRGGMATTIPLVVLVNGLSASASEIVAGAIQDYERGVLVGEQTFGKGSVQMPHILSDGSYFLVTIARWFTPDDHQIDKQGLTPDIEVLISQEDRLADRDPQLERAIEYLLDKR